MLGGIFYSRKIRRGKREGSSAWLDLGKFICQRLLSIPGHLWDLPWGKSFLVIHPKISSNQGFEEISEIGLFLKRRVQKKARFSLKSLHQQLPESVLPPK